MTVLDHVPVDRITAEARDVHFTRTALTALAGVFWVLGWSVAKACAVLWFAAAWVVVAVRSGWVDARTNPGPEADRP